MKLERGSQMKKISIIIPCYNEEEAIPYFYEEIEKITKKIKAKFEYIFVDDGSQDNTLKVIKTLAKKDKKIRYISFSRNFGKEASMLAGLEHATGDYVTTMDADLQDPPELLIEMFNTLENEEYDICGAVSISRNGYSFIRKHFTNLFYKIISKVSKTEMINGARDFRLMKRYVVEAIISMREYNRYSKGLFSFVGFKTKWIEFENKKRVAGKTKWSLWKLFIYAVEGIISFSTAPLIFSALLGLFFCIISFIMIIFIIIRTLMFGDPVAGWPSLVCIIFFLSGIQLFAIGIIGQYLAKTYLETKNRPIYIIRETEKKEQLKS